MGRVLRRAADVSPEKAAALGPNVMVFTDELIDEPVLRIEQVSDDYEDVALAGRRAADAVRAKAWANVGGLAPVGEATALRGSRCERCGSTSSLLASEQSSGPYRCLWGCE